MKTRLLLAVAICTAAAWMPSARADGLLDEQLGPKPVADAPKPADAPGADKPKPDAPSVTPKPADPNTPGGREIISPGAARKVDDEELIKQLTKPGDAAPDKDAIAARAKEMVARMDTAAQHLNGRDPGEVTQETEQRIIQDLDVMIAIAKQQQGGGQPQDPSQQQQQQQGQSRQQGQGQGQGMGGNTAATDDNLRGGGSVTPPGGDMRDKSAANWGGLPPRDRDEISHGANEEYLASYRELIDRYYQALAETAKGKSH